jgi:hypothetical protein
MTDHNCRTEEERKHIEANIEKYGCHICILEPTKYLPGFAYSIGLYKKFNHPEIICFGLKEELLCSVINHACDLISKGEKFEELNLFDGFLANYNIQFLPVNKDYYQNYVGYGGWFYGNTFDFPLLQLVWPDKQSLFPWQDGFNPNWKFKQPLLDRNTDFKFYEERNVLVFTTSSVLNGEPILYVYHDSDGAWQFHSSTEPDTNDGKLVCLHHITDLDKSVNELYHLDYGWCGWRKSAGDDWEFEEYDDEDEEEE